MRRLPPRPLAKTVRGREGGMDTQRTARTSSDEGTLGALTGLPGAVEVRSFAGGYSVAFPDRMLDDRARQA
jgi:hypothetical protein